MRVDGLDCWENWLPQARLLARRRRRRLSVAIFSDDPPGRD